ncbi:hypothetical protein, partial [Candidatus Thiosymbion oneisti]|uniref:hypothetical protein n=1 Tax=Candidatus Thiosymbion oneisti TaxID=589554 RepID=UPI001C40835E
MTNSTGRYAPSPAGRGLGRGDQKDESLYLNTYEFTTTKKFFVGNPTHISDAGKTDPFTEPVACGLVS